jgi:hypothetical protein
MADIDKLPGDRLFVDEANNAMDRETSFHRTHISDMRVDKWRDVLAPDAQATVTELFGDYSRLLESRAVGVGHAAGPLYGVKPLAPFAVTFSSTLFAPVDDVHSFSRFLGSREVTKPMGMKVLDQMFLPQGGWRVRITVPKVPAFEVRVCQNGAVIHETKSQAGVARFNFRNQLHDRPFDVHVRYAGMDADVGSNVPPPHALFEATFAPAA